MSSYRTNIVAAALLIFASHSHAEDRPISLPSTPDGRLLLAVDLHMHTVFSDGQVWPSLRAEEAVREGVDLIALTEHLEHQPHAEDIPHPDRNRSYAIAQAFVEREGYDLLVVNGAEVTRDLPPGHVNAVFLRDANALLTDDPVTAFRAARAQDAFVFWNHPHWLPQAGDGVARISPMHVRLIEDGLLHGIEVANGTLDGHSEHALDIALEHDLTVLGTSDIHGLVAWRHGVGHGGHRPLTLVLSPDRSLEAVRKALFGGQTVAWNYDDLLGREQHVADVVAACLTLTADSYPEDYSVLPVTIRNACPARFMLENVGEYSFQNVSDAIVVPGHDTFALQVRTLERIREVRLPFRLLNTQIGHGKNLEHALSAKVPL